MNSNAINTIIDNIQKQVEELSDAQLVSLQKELSFYKTKSADNAKYLPPTILEAIETVVNNKGENKYIFSILLTSCVKKILTPEQDIRIAQENMTNGYSNRSFDQRYITPFLKRHNYTHCEASGLESGRNLERPLPWDLNYQCNPRGRGNKEAFLGILEYIQEGKGPPESVAKYLLYYDKTKFVSNEVTIKPPMEKKISKIMKVFERHFAESSGQGKSRLPVLALYSIYTQLVTELSRYRDAELLTLERHTTADLRSGSIGDIQVNKDGQPFEGVEVKSEKTISASMINELPRKFNNNNVSRYYLLTTSVQGVLPEDQKSVGEAVLNIENQTGCQIIVNGLIKTLWYYLRLLSDPSNVLVEYQKLLETDDDIRQELKVVWNTILAQEYN